MNALAIESSVTLTPNRRLAAALLKNESEEKTALGQHCWETSLILPINTWLEKCWHELVFNVDRPLPRLLTQAETHVLWEEIIRASPESDSLLQVSQTVQFVSSAYQLLKQWEIPLSHPELTLTEEGFLFKQWAKMFEERCQTHHWISTADIPSQLKNSLINGKVIKPQSLRLVGFIEMPPDINSLLSAYQANGVDIIQSTRNTSPISIHRIALNDEKEEIITMARWAKALLEKNPSQKIGCIVPSLKQIRSEVQRLFLDVFKEASCFNISAGSSLSQFPVIYTLFQLLSLLNKTFSFETFSHLLRSPFLGNAEYESQQRAQYELTLRRFNQSSFSLHTLIDENDRLHLSQKCPNLSQRMKQFYAHYLSLENQLRPSEWANEFNQLLTIMGWPGERSINSEEYQVIQNSWLPLLEQYAQLDHVLSPITFNKAIHYLKQLADQTLFQPKTPEAPIQILGVLEAAGLSFDSLWVMGLDDTTWPSAPSPNPFIPLRLQKALNMPHAHAERELNYCKWITQQLIDSSTEVILSHAKKNHDIILRPSALIEGYPTIELDSLDLAAYISNARLLLDTSSIEWLTDAKAPQKSSHETISGGTSIFKWQAACPFKAFSESRLQAKCIDKITNGLSAQDRGKLVHQVLESLWQTLQTSDQLHAINDDALHQLIQTSVHHIIEDFHAKQTNHQSRFYSIEKKRLQQMAWDWLTLEKTRPHFRVVGLEVERQIQIDDLTLTIRVDRIDELDHSDHLIIDYKTGKNLTLQAWFGERMDEPQMPLYCVTEHSNVVGIAFAQCHPDQMNFKGISRYSLDISDIKPIDTLKRNEVLDWQAQKQLWHQHLVNLAHAFVQGDARVDPKTEEACNHCHLHSLCRIYEKNEFN